MSHNRSSRTLSIILQQLFEEKVDRFTLPNGLTVIFKQDHRCQLASAQVWVKTGSIHENDHLGSGLSHFLEHMLFKGTSRRTGREISCQIQNAGGYFNAYTTFDRTVYYIDLPCEKIGLALDVLSDMTFNSILPEEEVKKERNVILREIDMYVDDPTTQVSETLFHNAFRCHPYRYPIIGYRQLFEAVTREALQQYYREKYVPNNAVLVISGNLACQDVRDLAERYFGLYPRQRCVTSLIPEEPKQLALRRERLIGDVQICRGVMGFKIPGLSDTDSPTVDMLASILGNGNSAILWEKLRDERQLVHSIEVSSWNPGTTGLFCISYSCDPDNCEATEEAILQEIKTLLHKGIEDKRVEKAVRQVIVTEINMRKTVSGQASRQGFCEVVLGDFGYPQRYFERIQSITAKQISAVMEKYLVSHKMTAVTLNASSPETASQRCQKNEEDHSPLFETTTLKNGLRLIMHHDASLPKIHLRVTFCGGPLYEAPGCRGVTALMTTLLTADTRQQSASEVAETIESVGASLDEFYGNNVFGLATETLSQDFAIGLECLSQGLLNPVFKQERLDLERSNLIDEIKENEDEIVYYGMIHLRRIFFGNHPYNTIPEGNQKCLNAIDVDTVKAHYQKLVTGTNGVAVIAGDFDPDSDVDQLKANLEKLPTSNYRVNNVRFDKPAHTGSHEVNLPREQVVVFQAYPDAKLRDDDFIVGEVLEEIFSEMSGNLFTQVREKRSLAYFVAASRMAGWDAGMFFLYAGTHPKTYPDVLEQMDMEIERVRTGKLSLNELSRCQTYLKAKKRMRLQTLSARAALVSNRLLCRLPLDSWEDYDQRIEAVTLESVQMFAQKYFQDEKKVVLTVKP